VFLIFMAAAGCSGASGSDPAQPADSGVSDLSGAAARKACVDAWGEAIFAHPKDWSPGEAETPAECSSEMGPTWADLYLQGKERAEKRRLELPPIDDGASIAPEDPAHETDQP
jgi:hypothetical protein